MKKHRFSEEKIIGMMKQHGAGRKVLVLALACDLDVSEATIYACKSKFGGMGDNRNSQRDLRFLSYQRLCLVMRSVVKAAKRQMLGYRK